LDFAFHSLFIFFLNNLFISPDYQYFCAKILRL